MLTVLLSVKHQLRRTGKEDCALQDKRERTRPEEQALSVYGNA